MVQKCCFELFLLQRLQGYHAYENENKLDVKNF